jgi:hypothetical protein
MTECGVGGGGGSFSDSVVSGAILVVMVAVV